MAPLLAPSLETPPPAEAMPPAAAELSAASTPRATVPAILHDDARAASLGTGPRSPASREIARQCHALVAAAGSNEEKADAITALLMPGIDQAAVPDPSWVKATPEQVRLFVLETLEHTEGIRRIGTMRGHDWTEHDFEGDTSKLNPEITQFLAKPGRDASVQWAITQHNGAPHHDLWSNPHSSASDLAESATDIVNAWRMSRRVYDKPSWSWTRIEAVISADHADGRLSNAQRDALLEAIPFQQEYESRYGWRTA